MRIRRARPRSTRIRRMRTQLARQEGKYQESLCEDPLGGIQNSTDVSGSLQRPRVVPLPSPQTWTKRFDGSKSRSFQRRPRGQIFFYVACVCMLNSCAPPHGVEKVAHLPRFPSPAALLSTPRPPPPPPPPNSSAPLSSAPSLSPCSSATS